MSAESSTRTVREFARDLVGSCRQLGDEEFLRILRQLQFYGHARLQLIGIGLGHPDIDPHLMDIGHLEQFGVGAGAAGIDQGPDICLPRGHHAVERGNDALEAFQGRQPFDIRLRGRHQSLFCLRVPSFLIGGLARNCLRRQQAVPPFRGQLRQSCVRLDARQIMPRLIQLLVQFRRVDFSKQLTRFDVGADIIVPLLEVTGHAGIDRRLVECLDIAWQDQFLVLRAASWGDDFDCGNGLLFCPVGEICFVPFAQKHANDADDDRRSQDRTEDKLELPASRHLPVFPRRHVFWGFLNH